MRPVAPTDEITTREALEILGLKRASSISRYVESKTLTPSRTIPGKTRPAAAFLFWRHDVVRLAEQRAAERKAS